MFKGSVRYCIEMGTFRLPVELSISSGDTSYDNSQNLQIDIKHQQNLPILIAMCIPMWQKNMKHWSSGFGNHMNITGMLIQMQRRNSSPNGQQKHERNAETGTDKFQFISLNTVVPKSNWFKHQKRHYTFLARTVIHGFEGWWSVRISVNPAAASAFSSSSAV